MQIRGLLNPPASDQLQDLRDCKQVENLSVDPYCQPPGSTWSGTTTQPWCSPRRCRRSTGWWAAARAPESVTASRPTTRTTSRGQSCDVRGRKRERNRTSLSRSPKVWSSNSRSLIRHYSSKTIESFCVQSKIGLFWKSFMFSRNIDYLEILCSYEERMPNVKKHVSTQTLVVRLTLLIWFHEFQKKCVTNVQVKAQKLQ